MKLYRNWIINEVARAGEHTNERTYVRTYVRTYSHTYVRDRPYIPSTTLLCEGIIICMLVLWTARHEIYLVLYIFFFFFFFSFSFFVFYNYYCYYNIHENKQIAKMHQRCASQVLKQGPLDQQSYTLLLICTEIVKKSNTLHMS